MAGRHHKVRNYKFYDRFSWYIPGIGEMFLLLLFLLAGAVIGNMLTLVFTLALGPEAASEYAMIIAYPVMFIPPMMYASIKSRNRSMNNGGILLDSNNFGTSGGFICALIVMLGTLAASFCSDVFTSILPEMPETLKSMLESMTQGTLWVNFLCVSIFAPFFEEWLCRGMVLRGLLGNGIRPVWSIVISAVFFAFIHLNPWQAVPAFILGCLFGYVYYKTGSLKLTMLMHFTNNTFALILSSIPSLKDCDDWQELLPPQIYWPVFAILLVLIVFIVRFFHRISSPESGNCDKIPSLMD